MPEVAVDVADLAVGRSKMETAGGQSFLVCRSVSGFHATDGICPHQLKALEGSRIRGDAVMCPHHGARFQLDTGKSLSYALTARPLAIYATRVDGTTLFVTLPD